ncbi:MAG: CRISPR-associated helicase Cas3' [Chlorobium sp.]|jgi:CRISPR-associated endonuclease/helicase Cas3|nr:CRISPR-associated helicase Cas3' [Chlorobium sp.]
MRTPKISVSLRQIQPLSFDACLAKTRIENHQHVAGRGVVDHCNIVGEVAKELLARMPVFLRAALFPDGSELVAAVHDIGKVSPTFQEKIYRGTDGYIWNSLECLSHADPAQERNWGGHAGVSMATAQTLRIGKYIPEIIGQHHGYSSELGGRVAEDEVFGGKLWQEKRAELLCNLKDSLNTQFPALENVLQAKAVAGLTTVADWIGSGNLFDNPDENWQPLISQAVDAAGFVRPDLVSGLEFGDIFGFKPREIQRLLIQQAGYPGVYILEAPMGIGKTEAALYAAYSIMAAGGATGLYFALPTQLTSNKIHDRVNDFLKKIVTPESILRHALLLHSNAWLKEIEMGEDGGAGGSWFSVGKRGILAPFAVGTIDQALMAVMNVKHGFVRAFGLAGKVVILDEVHSYDAYTGTILDRLVETLRALQCTVIILSATLTKDRRMKILKQKVQQDSYPLITVSGNNSESPIEVTATVLGKTVVTIQSSSFMDMAMDEVLKRAEGGQQVLWIENTVSEAQQSFSILAARAAGSGIECGLLHSRFVKADRERNEEYWVTRYGKGCADLRQISGRILVGTQVLEQSLDIDADFLVTKICPTDMLLQRIGRLWRHSETIRPAGTCCDVWILKPEYNSALLNPEKEFGPTSKVYSPYVLLRTLEVWDGLTKIVLPEQIRTLIETTYREREESAVMTGYKAKLQQEKEKLERLALGGVSEGNRTLPESKASTRYSEQENVEVLLLRSFRFDQHGAVVKLLDGSSLFLPPANLRKSNKEQRTLAATLASYTLHVTDYLAPEAIPMKNLTWLKSYFYLGDSAHNESLLRVAVVGEDGELVSLNGGGASVKYRISYNPRSGYRSIKL